MNKQKVIIFEGLDRSGKTSIATETSKLLGIPYFKFEKHNYWDEKKYENATYYDQPFFVELLKQTGLSIVADRAYPSEYAYAPLFDRQLDEKFLRKIDDAHAELGTIIVLCIKRNVNEKDEKVPMDKYKDIISRYLDFSMWTKCHVIILDTTALDLESQINFLISHFRKEGLL